MNRQEQRNMNKKIALDTLSIIESGCYMTPKGIHIDITQEIDQSITNTKLYTPNELSKLKVESSNFDSSFVVTKESSLEACKKLNEEGFHNIGCLNFASAKNPGGGFLNGSSAQEESLARSSALYRCLKSDDTMYRKNKSCDSLLYTDYMICTPLVPVFKNDHGELLEKPYNITFISSPAPNIQAMKKKGDRKNLQCSKAILEKRIINILSVAENEKIDALVLGAFGWDPDVVASVFKKAFEVKFRNSFKKVVFAIYSSGVDTNYISFKKQFSKYR